MKTILATLLVVGLFVSAHAADAAQCKDSKGKFVKCPPPVTAALNPTTKATKCRDAKGKFIKCAVTAAVSAKPTQCRDAKGKFVKCPA